MKTGKIPSEVATLMTKILPCVWDMKLCCGDNNLYQPSMEFYWDTLFLLRAN